MPSSARARPERSRRAACVSLASSGVVQQSLPRCVRASVCISALCIWDLACLPIQPLEACMQWAVLCPEPAEGPRLPVLQNWDDVAEPAMPC